MKHFRRRILFWRWSIFSSVLYSIIYSHLFCTLTLYLSIHLFVQLLSFFCSSVRQNCVFFLCFFSSIIAFHFFLTTSGASLITSPVSFSPPILPSPLPPSCLCASASIEGPSVPIHHALHFSLLAGINHKYFIIHHGRLSPAHRQFITAALSAGLPQQL